MEAHREKILEEWNSWVTAGVDEPIEQVKRIRTGKTGPPPSKQHRGRGANTPIERRYEWAARYLLGIPLKEIAGAEADPSTVGKIVREILQIAGWPPR